MQRQIMNLSANQIKVTRHSNEQLNKTTTMLKSKSSMQHRLKNKITLSTQVISIPEPPPNSITTKRQLKQFQFTKDQIRIYNKINSVQPKLDMSLSPQNQL